MSKSARVTRRHKRDAPVVSAVPTWKLLRDFYTSRWEMEKK